MTTPNDRRDAALEYLASLDQQELTYLLREARTGEPAPPPDPAPTDYPAGWLPPRQPRPPAPATPADIHRNAFLDQQGTLS